MVLVAPTYHCSYSASLCCCSFGASNMSVIRAPLCGLAVTAELSATLVCLSGAANLLDDRVPHLLAQRPVSSPHFKA